MEGSGQGHTLGVIPPPPDAPLIHTRAYDVQAYRLDAGTILLRGIVRDTKPGGLYIAEDTEPMDIHHMVMDLTIDMRGMLITDAKLVMDTRPHTVCTDIVPHYSKLVGLSIARGFSNKVRELFGGPRGCTHTTALLLAMGPVAIQSMWSMRAAANREAESGGTSVRVGRKPTREEREAGFAMNLNTCHVWDAEGAFVAQVRAGADFEVPLWAEERMRKLGIPPERWHERMAE